MSTIFIGELIALIVAISSLTLLIKRRKFKDLVKPELESVIIDLSEFKGVVISHLIINFDQFLMAIQKDFSEALKWTMANTDSLPFLTYEGSKNINGSFEKAEITIAHLDTDNDKILHYAEAQMDKENEGYQAWQREIDFPFYIEGFKVVAQKKESSPDVVEALIFEPVVAKKYYQAWPILWLFVSVVAFITLLLIEISG